MSTINLYLDKKSDKSLKELQELLETTSKSGTIRRALTIAHILGKYVKEGFKVCLEKDDDKKEVIIT